MAVKPTVSEARPDIRPPDGTIAIVVLTHNRLHLLRKCVENVLLRTTEATSEIVIWDNGSTDGTAEYLSTLSDPRIQVVISPENVGFNAYARGFRRTTAPYMVELDDDIVDAPEAWDARLRDAFVRLPDVGFLAADLVDDPHDIASKYRHHIRAHEYVPAQEHGVNLLLGPAGSGCALTSRELNERVGGFRERENEIFWLEDAAYIDDLGMIGFRAVVAADVVVHHTGGPHYAAEPLEKVEYWKQYWARQRRRDAVKALLVRLPFVRRLNEHFGWFVAP